jgi:3-dehydroquinate synthase
MSARSVRVRLGGRSYSVELDVGSLDGLGDAVKARLDVSRALVLSVPPVARRYGGRATRSLRQAGLRVHRFEVPDGERSKSLRQAERLYGEMLDAGADRGSSVVVALGGGVVGDLAGFLAATLFRGIPVVQVPTTLLSMVDSSVGGKTGVNVAQGKNLVGAFHQPSLVWIDAKTLETLPARQLRAGMAEVVKHAAIWDARLFSRLERQLEPLMALDPPVLVPILERNCRIKATVVSRDEREGGLRMLLNFGHTLGHAVEALKGYRGVLHGEAVSMGMVYAAGHSERLGLAPAGTQERIEALLGRIGLPTKLPSFERRAYLKALSVDKKKRDRRIRFVALRGIGKAETVPLLPSEILPAGVLPRR